MRQFRTPSRWIWTAPILAAGLAVACDNSLEGVGVNQTWGFVILDASKALDGTHYADPQGLFFLGNLSAVPVADVLADTCADGAFLDAGNNLAGVTYLDAGPSIEAVVGGTPWTLDRTVLNNDLSYRLASGPLQYTPGDSVWVTVPGSGGGYPSALIRAKTAEAFAFPNVDIPAGTETIHLTWTTPQDPRSSMIVSLRYSANGGSVLNRQVLCTFIDDGIDSIPFRWHENWSSSSGASAVVATRLRAHYVGVGNANLGVVSTYQVPTPSSP